MRFGSVCSGIEAASVAWAPLGWKAAWFSEIEAFPSAVLAHHHPDVPNLGDMTALPAAIRSGAVEAPDVLCGGTPCQAFSFAGKRQSLDDARGNLSLTYCEIANAIDDVRSERGERPCIAVWENVPGVLSTKDNAFGCFLGELAGESCELQPAGRKWTNAGVVYGPARTVAWRVLDAQYFGVAQRRKRVVVVASARMDIDTGAILFEFDRLRRDTAPRREPHEEIAGATSPRAFGGGNCSGSIGVAACLTAKGNRQDFEAEKFVVQACGEVCPTLAAGGNVTGGHRPPGTAADTADSLIAIAQPLGVTIHGTHPSVQKIASFDDIAQCLRARTPGNIDNSSTTVVAQPVCFTTKDYGADATMNLAPTMRSMGHADSHANGGGQLGVAWWADFIWRVRRLMPVECERLQGFPDGYTRIPYRKKPADQCPDGPRYKALGNSWAVPKFRWLGARIQLAALMAEQANDNRTARERQRGAAA